MTLKYFQNMAFYTVCFKGALSLDCSFQSCFCYFLFVFVSFSTSGTIYDSTVMLFPLDMILPLCFYKEEFSTSDY